MGIEAHHALTRADYEAESADRVRVVDGEQAGGFSTAMEAGLKANFAMHPHMCIWLTGLAMLEDRAKKEDAREE